MTKDAFYFSHDSNAHKDPKILKLRSKFGWEGYGIYWAIIETLREQTDYKWKASDKQLLSFCFANGDEMVNQVIDECLSIGLLAEEGDYIHSESLTRRMKMKEDISEKRRAAGRKGGSSKSKANAKQNESNKGNKRKEINKEKERHLDHVLLTKNEYERLVNDFGKETVDNKIDDLNNYIGSKGKRYKDHNLTLRGWLKKDAPVLRAVPSRPKKSIDQIKHEEMLRENGMM